MISALKDDLISGRAVSNLGLFVALAVALVLSHVGVQNLPCVAAAFATTEARLTEARAAAGKLNCKAVVGEHSPYNFVLSSQLTPE